MSNACDAVTKLRRLTSLGQVSDIPDDYKITVKADREERTITVSDNGIGMTEEELDRYLCQIALSGALDFINKYEGEENRNNGIIGHFGLGFYSSFMVSDRVTVVTKSYTGAPAVKWECTDSGEYTLSPSDKETRGTDVIMHIADGEDEYLEDGKLKSILEQYYGADIPAELLFDVNTTFVQLVKAVDVAMEREMDRRSRSIGSRFSGRSRSEARRKQRSTHLPSGRSARSSAARFDGLFVETYFGWT